MNIYPMLCDDSHFYWLTTVQHRHDLTFDITEDITLAIVIASHLLWSPDMIMMGL